MYVGYELTENSRQKLMDMFPPKYSRIFGHHITTKFGTNNPNDIPEYTEDTMVVGYADTGDGLEALVVTINGDSKKEDGNFFHITWSLNPEKYKPVDSNKVVENYSKIAPVPIQLIPKMFYGKTPFVDRNEIANEGFINFLKSI